MAHGFFFHSCCMLDRAVSLVPLLGMCRPMIRIEVQRFVQVFIYFQNCLSHRRSGFYVLESTA
jgi:hypothetical protein